MLRLQSALPETCWNYAKLCRPPILSTPLPQNQPNSTPTMAPSLHLSPISLLLSPNPLPSRLESHQLLRYMIPAGQNLKHHPDSRSSRSTSTQTHKRPFVPGLCLQDWGLEVGERAGCSALTGPSAPPICPTEPSLCRRRGVRRTGRRRLPQHHAVRRAVRVHPHRRLLLRVPARVPLAARLATVRPSPQSIGT